jgi:hypothetical protein
MVEREFPGVLCSKVMGDLDKLAALGLRYASPELADSSSSNGGGAGKGGGGGGEGSKGGGGAGSVAATTATSLDDDAAAGPPQPPPEPRAHTAITFAEDARGNVAVAGSAAAKGAPRSSLATRSLPTAPPLASALQRNSFRLTHPGQGVAGGGGGAAGAAALLPAMDTLDSISLRTSQEQVLSNLLRVRELVQVSRARLDQQRVNDFLNACSEGNWHRIRTVRRAGGGGGEMRAGGGVVAPAQQGHAASRARHKGSAQPPTLRLWCSRHCPRLAVWCSPSTRTLLADAAAGLGRQRGRL